MTARPLDTWRCALLATHINELFTLTRAVDVPRYSVRADPRSAGALTMLESDPFVSAVWSLDQARKFDLPGVLNDAEHYCARAEREIISQRTRLKLRQTPRYKQLLRIGALRDAECRASCALWEGDVRVCDLPFDGVLVENLIKQAINYYEYDDLDAAERTCVEIEQLMMDHHDNV